ncbi:MAG TPA: DUF4286 family protein [Puia sp.]|nr:DUF4286 family protein [Puia sp.]
MIVYNLTIKVSWGILDNWLPWELQEHIPAVMATELFDDYKFYRLLDEDETEGPTFVLQYFTGSLERYEQYITGYASRFRQEGLDKWGDGFIAFRTLMSLYDPGS